MTRLISDKARSSPSSAWLGAFASCSAVSHASVDLGLRRNAFMPCAIMGRTARAAVPPRPPWPRLGRALACAMAAQAKPPQIGQLIPALLRERHAMVRKSDFFRQPGAVQTDWRRKHSADKACQALVP
jgi:hypothetical protein